jgi:hypothetical protein
VGSYTIAGAWRAAAHAPTAAVGVSTS